MLVRRIRIREKPKVLNRAIAIVLLGEIEKMITEGEMSITQELKEVNKNLRSIIEILKEERETWRPQ